MTHQTLTIGAVAAALSLSVVGSSWAAPQAGSRPNTGETVGSAAPRGGEGGSSNGTTSGSTSSGSSSSSSSSSGGSVGGNSAASPWGSAGGAAMRREAPERPAWADQQRGGGSIGSGERASGGERAVPRGSGSNPGGSVSGGSSMPMTTSAGAASRSSSGPNRSAVPDYSRPRGNRPAIGDAGERAVPPPGTGGSNPPYSPVYYDPYYYYGYGGGYYGSRYSASCGYGYGYYNPYCGSSWGYSPWLMAGYGFGFGYFGYDASNDPFGYGYAPDPYEFQGGGGGGGYSSSARGETGSLHLKVKPGNAEVFVDGYYVGTIDSFDGAFEKLSVAAGPHKIELRADGYQPEQFEVLVKPGENVAYKGELKRIR